MMLISWYTAIKLRKWYVTEVYKTLKKNYIKIDFNIVLNSLVLNEIVKCPQSTSWGPNGLNWQCCLACSSKMAPIAMGVDYSFEVKTLRYEYPHFSSIIIFL